MEGSSAAASSRSSDDNVRLNCVPFNDNLPLILKAVVILSAIISGVLIAIVVKSLVYTYMPNPPDFSVDSFSLSNFTITNESRMFMDSEIRLTVRNPNGRFSLSYENTVASLYHEYVLLSQRGIPRFSHEAGNETSMVIKFDDGNIVDRWVVDGIRGEINGSVRFNFWFISRIVWGYGSSEDDTYRVLCKDLVVGIPNNGSSGRLTRKPKYCDVRPERCFIT